jgi:hypothetical protein
MKAKRIFAGLSAAVIAATMAMTASANKLSSYVYPSETETDKNDAYYSIGALGFFMNNDGKWAWNQSEWFGIDAEGKISVEYKISSILADKSMSGKGSLGEMGVMVCNIDKAIKTAGVEQEAGYPIDVKVTDAKFVAEDGTETVFNDMLNITEVQRDAEGDIRFHIRPTDKVDEATGDVLLPANPEVAGWDAEGAFNGGTLYFTLDFGTPSADDAAESKTESKADSSSAAESSSAAKSDATSSAASDATDNTNSNTGAATGAVLGLMAVAAAGAIVTKKKH